MEIHAANAQISSGGGDVFSHNTIHVSMEAPPQAHKIDLTKLKLSPLPSTNFVGREDALDAMRSYFFATENRLSIFVLYGLGGAGKTQIAFKFIHTYYNQDPKISPRLTNVFCVDASSAKALDASFKDIAINTYIGQSKDDVLSWLSYHKESWLLFFDNADDPSLNLRPYFPHCNHGNILITTRNHRSCQYYTDRQPSSAFEIAMLPPDIARALLKTAAALDDTPQQAEADLTLVEELGCLALAITQAGAAIYQLRLTCDEYLAMFKARRTKLLQECEVDPRALDDYPKSISTTWLMSYEGLSSNARQLLDFCAFFHHRGITEDIFRNAAEHIKDYTEIYPTTITTDETEAIYQAVKCFLSIFLTVNDSQAKWNSICFRSTLEELCSFSLFSYSDHSYSMHPLVHDWAQNFCQQEDAQRRHQAELLLAFAGLGGYQTEIVRIRRQLLPHVDEILKDRNLDDIAPSAIIDVYGAAYMATARWKDAEKLRTEVLRRNVEILGEDHAITVTSKANLASVYRQQERFQEAEELEVEVLEKFRETRGEDDWNTLQAMANLAGTYQRSHKYRESEILGLRVLEGLRRGFGDENAATMRAMRILAGTYYDLGKWDEAEKLEVELLDIRRRCFGDAHPDTFVCMVELSLTYVSQGRLNDAKALQVSALQKYIETTGRDSQETTSTMSTLANTYEKLGWIDDAISLRTQVMDSWCRILGEDHPTSLRAMNTLANTCAKEGRYEAARPIRERILEVVTQNPHWQVGDPAQLEDSLQELGSTLINLGRFDEAEKIHRRLLEQQQRRLGDKHESTIVTTVRLALSLQSQLKWDEMELLVSDALDKIKHDQKYGEDHSLTLSLQNFLVWSYISQGRMQEAEELQVNLVEKRTRISGEQDPATLKAVHQLEHYIRRSGTDGVSSSTPTERSDKRSSFSRLTSKFKGFHRHKS